METEPLQIRLAVRELVEFVLRRGRIQALWRWYPAADQYSPANEYHGAGQARV